MFYAFTLLVVLYATYVASREGGGSALRKSFVLVALLFPTWMTYNVRSIRLDFRIVQAAIAFGLLIAFPPKKAIRFELCLTDLLVLSLTTILCCSQYLSGALAPLTPVDIACTWIPTYLVGRFFLQSREDLAELAPMLSKVVAFVCVLAVFEALAHTNILNTILGKRFGILESGEGYRWGMKRAQGNVSHPIYNGFQLILFLCLALPLMHWGWTSSKKRWLAIASPLILGVAIFATVSRGAQLGYLIACAVAAFLMLPRLRLPMCLVAVVMGGTLFAFRGVLVESLGALAGENSAESRIIVVDGEEVEYTGTKHRLLLLQVYKEPLAAAGWFGWGGSLKGVQIDPELEQRFGSIDSHYILFFLQYGRLGTIAFIAISLFVALNSIRVAWGASAWQPVAAGLAGGFVALAISMSSVWFAPDYAAIWLFCAGLSCNIKTLWRHQPGHGADVVIADVAANCLNLFPRRQLIPVTQRRSI